MTMTMTTVITNEWGVRFQLLFGFSLRPQGNRFFSHLITWDGQSIVLDGILA